MKVLMEISMIPYDPTRAVAPGKYLVKTKTQMNENMFAARVTKVLNQKTGKYENRVDVTNQIVTHISEEPVL